MDVTVWEIKQLAQISFKLRLEAQYCSPHKYHSSSTELLFLLHLLLLPFTSPSRFKDHWCISKTLPRFTVHSTERSPHAFSRAPTESVPLASSNWLDPHSDAIWCSALNLFSWRQINWGRQLLPARTPIIVYLIQGKSCLGPLTLRQHIKNRCFYI